MPPRITNWHIEGTPRRVYHWYYVKSLAEIRSKEQTFFVKYYQYLQWAPTEKEYLAFTKNPENALKHGSIFVPIILPSNALEANLLEVERKGNLYDVHILRGGSDSYNIYGERLDIPADHLLFGISRIYQCRVSCAFSLKQFPFDMQSLHLFFEASEDVKSKIFLPVYGVADCVGLEIGAMANDSQFEIKKPVIEFSAFSSEDASSYACCTLTLKAQRISFAILVKVFTPATCLSLLCLCVFALPKEDGNRLSIVVTLALALTAFQYVVGEYLPDLPYTTWADLYVMLSFLFCTAVCVYTAIGIQFATTQTDRLFMLIFAALFACSNAFFVYASWRAGIENARMLPLSYSELDSAGDVETKSTVMVIPQSAVKLFMGDEFTSVAGTNLVEQEDEEKEVEAEVEAEADEGVEPRRSPRRRRGRG